MVFVQWFDGKKDKQDNIYLQNIVNISFESVFSVVDKWLKIKNILEIVQCSWIKIEWVCACVCVDIAQNEVIFFSLFRSKLKFDCDLLQ